MTDTTHPQGNDWYHALRIGRWEILACTPGWYWDGKAERGAGWFGGFTEVAGDGTWERWWLLGRVSIVLVRHSR